MSFRRVLVLLVLLLFVIPLVQRTQADRPTAWQPWAPPQATTERWLPNRVLVSLRTEGVVFRQRAFTTQAWSTRWGVAVRQAQALTADVFDTLWALDFAPPADVPALVERIAADPAVLYAEPDYVYHTTLTPDDEYYDRQYALRTMRVPQAWNTTTGHPEVLIAVVDTGVYAAHPDFGGKIVRGYDFWNDDTNPADDQGHGTHTAGILGAVGNNGQGVAGMCWQCRILAIKALNSNGAGSSSAVARGVRYATDHGARVINLSLGGTDDARTLRDAVQYAVQRDVLVVAAVGNEAKEGNPVEYPAAYPDVLGIAATNAQDQHAFFSNYGAYVDVAAPGVGIASTLWVAGRADYGTATGTSEAVPHVVGLAGLIWSTNLDLSSIQVRDLITGTADDLGAPGRDDLFGAGRINAERAIAAASATLPTATPTSSATTATSIISTPTRDIPPIAPTSTASPPTTATPTPSKTPADALVFPETGYSLRGEFQRFWTTNGGLPVFGFPIGEEQQEQTSNGVFVVQYFERNRFELHPERPTPNIVLLGRLGDTLLQRNGIDWAQLPKTAPQPRCQYFPSGHNVCGAFLERWRGGGIRDPKLTAYSRSLALWGLPLTEPRLETNAAGDQVLTQWFERARFEDHGPKGVLLGLLGREFLAPPSSLTATPTETRRPLFP